MQGEWTHSIFGCFDNITLCLITYFVPCYTFGRNAESLGEDCLTCGICYACGWGQLAHYALRERLKERRNIGGSLWQDICFVTFCAPCALAQEAQEIQEAHAAGETLIRQ